MTHMQYLTSLSKYSQFANQKTVAEGGRKQSPKKLLLLVALSEQNEPLNRLPLLTQSGIETFAIGLHGIM
jgi:hypothetical protein